MISYKKMNKQDVRLNRGGKASYMLTQGVGEV